GFDNPDRVRFERDYSIRGNEPSDELRNMIAAYRREQEQAEQARRAITQQQDLIAREAAAAKAQQESEAKAQQETEQAAAVAAQLADPAWVAGEDTAALRAVAAW